ncbi:hypothetical protein HJ526_05245 [Donghicola sp. C2-DW-16]|uniref:EAL domain-containing protein n=1 Tax=Donghicola mangrovi TaxID=2729614 RepID=A0ABX2PBF2_9RHOB|nr:hypothetical protein [Donghicola mangrovi]NVO26814.1 hypothetical protein [Donghicola mangrovi]
MDKQKIEPKDHQMQKAQISKQSILMDADRASQIFWQEFMKSGIEDAHQKSLFRAMLGDPILRPLIELRENGATSIEGALLLKSIGFLTETVIAIRSGPLSGQKLICVALTRRAVNCTSRWRMRIQNDRDDQNSLDFLKSCIRNYLVIDRGAGIAVTEAVGKVALDLFDERILGRLAALDYDLLQFDLDIYSNNVSESHWLNCEALWSKGSKLPRTGAGIIDLCYTW